MPAPDQPPLTPNDIGDQLDKLWERIKPAVPPVRIPHPRHPTQQPPSPRTDLNP